MSTCSRPPFFVKSLSSLAALCFPFVLVSCGGGGSAGGVAGGSGSTFSGLALDAPVAAAVVTITDGAPLGVAGSATLGQGTAGTDGTFNVTGLVLPSGTTPIFATVQSPTNQALVMTSYLGPANAINAVGNALTSSILPDLDVTPVTTAALAVYAQLTSGSYATLTPTLYSQTLVAHRSDILAIAAAIKAVGDNLCSPTPAVTSTATLATSIASTANLANGPASTLTTAGMVLGGTCPAVLAGLAQQISADPHFGPELDLGDVVDAGVAPAVPAGSYSLQGVVAELGAYPATMTGLFPAAMMVPAAHILSDNTVTVSPNGIVTSTDGGVAGQINGNLLTLTLIDGTQHYAMTGKVGVLPMSMVNGSTGYALRSGGTNQSSNDLTQFQAVLLPVSSTPITPVWNGWIAQASQDSQGGYVCATGQLVRLDVLGNGLASGAKLGQCLSSSVNSWAMTSALFSGSEDYFDGRRSAPSVSAPQLTAAVWNAPTTTPFVLVSPASSLVAVSAIGAPLTVSGVAYYVMGGDTVILTGAIGAAASQNLLLSLHDGPLTQWTESASINSASIDNSQSQSNSSSSDHAQVPSGSSNDH